jgi:hypothetical protein
MAVTIRVQVSTLSLEKPKQNMKNKDQSDNVAFQVPSEED